MRLLVVWPDKSIEVVKMLKELERRSHQVLYWVGYDDSEMRQLPNTVFHSYRDAVKAEPAPGVDVSDFAPPGTDVIEKLYRTESLTLTMLNLLAPNSGVSERKHLYYHMVRYWLGVLKKYQPDAVILSYIPHYSYDFVLYSLAKLLGINVLLFVDTRVPGRLLPLTDFWQGSVWLQRALESNRGKHFNVEDLADDIRKYYVKTAAKDFNELPGNLKFLKKKHSLFQRLLSSKVRVNIQDGTIIKKALGYASRVWRNGDHRRWIKNFSLKLSYLIRDNSKKEYHRFLSKPDFSKKFVYAPLQVQPECSTSPQGGVFVDQILMLETLSAALPEDWLIYVKEHPAQWLRFGPGFSSYKNRGYYEKIARIKNVLLVPLEVNSYNLIKESRAVMTTTGAPGWEATLWSKPALIFGYPWYMDCPGIFRVDSVASCRAAINSINDDFRVDPQLAVNYLKALEKAAIQGYRAPSAGEGSDLSHSESMKNITDFIVAELPKLR